MLARLASATPAGTASPPRCRQRSRRWRGRSRTCRSRILRVDRPSSGHGILRDSVVGPAGPMSRHFGRDGALHRLFVRTQTRSAVAAGPVIERLLTSLNARSTAPPRLEGGILERASIREAHAPRPAFTADVHRVEAGGRLRPLFAPGG